VGMANVVFAKCSKIFGMAYLRKPKLCIYYVYPPDRGCCCRSSLRFCGGSR
jgi:hypothetical protein